MDKSRQPHTTASRTKPLRVGYVPLVDCAPLVMAKELGLFARYGIEVALSREPGWATIRDKIIFGELEAAHAVPGMPFAVTLGLGSVACDCVSGLVLNLHGNAITLSHELWSRGVRDARTLREFLDRTRRERTLTFGVVFPFSTHNFLLRHWLASADINPDRDVRLAVVPPPQMFSNLRSGNLDGYCVGEPWNSAAVRSRAGWIAATSLELAPMHPEKVLLARRKFAEERADEHIRLIAALLDACAWCDEPEHRAQVAATLARPEYLNTPAASLEPSLCGPFDFGHGRSGTARDFHIFHRHDANEPSLEKAGWILSQLLNAGVVRDPLLLRTPAARRVFRPETYLAAQKLRRSPNRHENEKPDTKTALALSA
jgi:ABC-type nitrate/sulfonate/bicarbonate transport system substrate-binding protein